MYVVFHFWKALIFLVDPYYLVIPYIGTLWPGYCEDIFLKLKLDYITKYITRHLIHLQEVLGNIRCSGRSTGGAEALRMGVLAILMMMLMAAVTV